MNSLRVSKNFARIIMMMVVIFITIFLYLNLEPGDHHPDGYSLQYFSCEIEQPFYSNGIALIPYDIITNCNQLGPQLQTTILNLILMAFLSVLIFDRSVSMTYVSLQILSAAYLMYSIFMPSKEILLAVIFAIGITTEKISIRYASFIVFGLIRPSYLLLLLYPYFKTKRKALLLLGLISFLFIAVQQNYFGEPVTEIYREKASEYDGVALPIFNALEEIAYLIRVFWNFIGVFGSIYSLSNQFHWNVFFSAINQIPLLLIFVNFVSHYNSISKYLDERFVIFILFAYATAAWPLPHSRYLYPMLPAALWWLSVKKANQHLKRNASVI